LPKKENPSKHFYHIKYPGHHSKQFIMNPGGSRGPTGNSGQSGDFDGQHTYVIQDSRRESQDEELEGAGVEMQEGDIENAESGELREQDRFLPIANVARIMKKGIPSQGKIAKDARECVQECVSEFISFITSEASDRCQAEKRKTINGEDILFAMSTLGFDNYVEPLKLYLQKYREAMKGDKGQGAEGTFEDGMVHDVSDGTTLLATSTLQQIRTDQSGGQVLLTYGGNQSFQLS